MRYCKKCVMPDTRPYMRFDDEGICYPCRAAEKLEKTDWKQRWIELEKLVEHYRGKNGTYYDCIIAVRKDPTNTHLIKLPNCVG